MDLAEFASGMIEAELKKIPSNRESDMGGSGGEQEINWGDVVDVVKEALSIDATIQEAMGHMHLGQINDVSNGLREMDEYKEAVDKLESFAEAVKTLMQKGYEKGILDRESNLK